MARTVKYAGNTLVIDDDALTLDQIRTSMSEVFPELQNATARQEGETITFEVKAGTKGMARTVKYAGNTLVIDDDALTLDQIRTSMSEVFPELQNATARQDGETITFEVKAGTKGLTSLESAIRLAKLFK